MKFLLILLLYNFHALAGSDFCDVTCVAKSSIVPIFAQNSTIEADLIRIHLLSQVNSCFRGSFVVDVYLAASQDWIQCCDARSCSRAILSLGNDDFYSQTFSGLVDKQDSSGVLKIVEIIAAENSRTPYVLTNFLQPKIWSPEEDVKVTLVTDRAKDFGLDLHDGNETKRILSYEDLTKLKTAVCYRGNKTCDPQPTGKDETAVELRIFLGFSSKGHFMEIVTGMANFLANEYFDGQRGKVLIFGPRAKILAKCWWHNVHKCILGLLAKGNDSIFVKTDKISRDDVDFAPDVMGFMRREAIKERELPPTVVLVLSDFISVNFLNNKYIFQKALEAQKVAIIYGIVLPWNKLDKATVMQYYGKLLSVADLYPMELFADLNNLTDRILNISFERPGLSKSITTTLTPSQTGVPITDTPHPSDVVIVLALAYWTDFVELEMLKNFLIETAGNCADEGSKYAVQDSQEGQKTAFCADQRCFMDQVNMLDLYNAISEYDNTVDLIKHALDILKPSRMPTSRVPSVYLVTNYVSEKFMRNWDDSQSDFRTNLSFVDFQVMLVNTSNDLHIHSSLSNKVIHVYPTFEDLKTAKNIFCPTKEYQPPEDHHKAKIGTLGVIVLCVSSAVLFIALVAIAYSVQKNIRKRKISRMSDKEPIISRDLDELGKEILNISGLARTRVDPWEMSRQQIIQGAELGRGSGGVVYRGSILGRAPCEYIYRRNFYAYQYDNCPVAIKEQLIGSDEKGRQQLLDEIEIMKAIRPHQNIANMLGCVTTVNPICLVIEYAEGGNLKQFLKGKLVLPSGNQLPGDNVIHQRDVIAYLWQIADGLAFVHHCGVAHRDVAARNVLIKRGRDVLIADFGLAIWKESGTSLSKIKRLPIKWTPPEALSRAQFSEASDVWSFGVCAWEILMSGADPFDHVPQPEILSYLHSGRRLERPDACSDPLWKILRSCWLDDAEKRPGFNFIKTELSLLLEDICSGYGYVTPLRE